MYKSGLILKHLAPASLDVATAPDSLTSFVSAPFIRDLPSFGPMIHRHAQETIQIDQRMRVVRDEQRGLVGRVIDTSFGQAAVIQEDVHDAPLVQVPLCSLVPVYRPGDHVKGRWSRSTGIILSVDETDNCLTYVESGLHRQVSIIFIS